MKAKIRVATDMYEFIELDVDMSLEDMWHSYKELKNYTMPKVGIEPKEFNKALDRYLTDGTGSLETYQLMSPPQQAVFQEIKKAFKRIKARNGEKE